MSLRLYNTGTRRVDPFTPVREENVRIYVCGMTPSAEAHLGHARSFLTFDVLRRHLAASGYRVTFVQNVTDIDDRSIQRGAELGIPWSVLMDQHYASFKRSMRALHVLEMDHEPRATVFIPQIIEMIQGLLERGHAYVVDDGVYYAVKTFERYGALSGRNVDELLIGARIAPGENKHDPLDFALWKFAKPGEPLWESPWGSGRPGWHIECSAMSHVLLGEPFDIHGGGYDLVFPHHENEIAQSEPLLDGHTPMVNVWMHGGLLMFNGKKMSKSLGNFEPLSNLLERHDPQAIRLLFLQTGYRKPMNFTEASIEGATSALERLLDAYDRLRRESAAHIVPSAHPERDLHRRRFIEALDDDLNTAAALSSLFDVVRETDTWIDSGEAAPIADFLLEAMDVLGISPNERTIARSRSTSGADEIPSDLAERFKRLRSALSSVASLDGVSGDAFLNLLIETRRDAKRAKDFTRADQIRKALADEGISLVDGRDGTTSWAIVQ